MKRKNKNLPTYTYERTTFAGIGERLALASLAFSKTWQVEDKGWKGGKFMHSVRFLGNKEGWEAGLTWADNFAHVNLEAAGIRRFIAEGIEGSRAAWYENQHPSKELLAIVASVAAKKAA